MPRIPRIDGRSVAVASLIIATILIAALGGALFYYGLAAMTPRVFTVSGIVYEAFSPGGGQFPAPKATVNLTGENGLTRTLITGPSGQFSFSGIPSGGVSINASATGFSPATVELFVSSVYSSGARNAVSLLLVAGPVSGGTTTVEGSFPNLESFVASTWSATVLFGIAAVVTGMGAFLTQRRDRAAVGVAGGVAAVLAPVSLTFLGVLLIFPLVTVAAEALVVVGLLAATMLAIPMALMGKPPHPE